MRRSTFVPVLFSTLLIPFSLTCSAQVVDVTACRAIKDSLERFACYEALGTETAAPAPAVAAPAPAPQAAAPQTARTQVERAEPEEEKGSLLGRLFNRDDEDEQPEPTSPPATATTGATTRATTRATTQGVESFGRNPEPAAARVEAGADGKSELVDTVASLKEIGPKVWLVTLKSGQRWRQISGRQYNLKVGDEVKIYNAGWGNSFRLSSDGASGFIQVERVD